MFGNNFGFIPGAITHYGFGDDDLYDGYRLGKKPLIELSKHRLDIYVTHLIKEGYGDDFLSFGLHDKFIDNAMPNPNIVEQIEKFNEAYGDIFQVELVTLDEFFLATRNIVKPRFTGDWPDWCTYGIASAPQEVKLNKNITSK